MKKLLHKSIILLLVLTLVLSLFAGFGLQANAYTHDCLNTIESLVDLDVFTATVAEGLANCAAYVDVQAFKIPSTDTNKDALSHYIRYYMPEFFHVTDLSFLSGANIVRVNFNYDSRYNTPAKYTAAKAVMDAEIYKLLYGLSDNELSEEEKALVLHDRLITYLSYDLGIFNNSVDEDSYNLTGVFFKRSAVGDGYSKAYSFMLKSLGISSLIVDSTITINQALKQHSCNIVYVDGVPYYVDCTLDDPTNSFEGNCRHEYFLRSYDALLSAGHGGVVTNVQVKSTKYDNYYWQKSLTAFQLIDGRIYYIDNENGLLRCATTGEALCSVEAMWMPDDSHFYVGNYAKLCSNSKNLFFNLTDSVYVYNLKTNVVKKLFSPDVSSFGEYYSIYGLSFEDDIFVCYYYNSANYDANTTANYAVTVSYEKLKLTVTFNGEQGSVTGAGHYEEDETVILTATAKPGYVFNGFYQNGNLIADSNIYSFIINTNINITALFDLCKHSTTTTNTVKPTCVEQGYTIVTCQICGFEQKQDYVASLGHKFGEWTEKDEAIAPTCIQNGKTAVEMRICSRCNSDETRGGEIILAKEHTPAVAVKENEVAPTCTEAGIFDEVIYCSACQTELSREPKTVAALGHISVTDEAVAPTCTNTGLTQGSHCSRCGEVFVAQDTIHAFGHDWTNWSVVTAPEGCKNGLSIRICNTCNAIENLVIPASGTHTPAIVVKENETAPTCIVEGSYEEVVKCSVCGEELSRTAKTVPALGHTYKAVTTKPTGTTLGYSTHTCSLCGDSFNDSYTAPTGKLTIKHGARTSNAIKVAWNNVGTATGYQVQISAKDGKKWSTYATLKAGTTAYTFKTLAAGNNYKFRVRFYIKAADGKNYYSPWSATLGSPTLPTGTTLTKLTSAKKAFNAQWKKNAAVNGYQIQYGLKSNFSGAKTLTVKNAKNLKAAVKKLNAKKVYYVRIRTYKTISKANYYSAWSKTYKVKTK